MDEQLKNIMEVQSVGFSQRKKVIIIAAVVMAVALLCLGILVFLAGDAQTRKLAVEFSGSCIFIMAFFLIRMSILHKELKPSILNLPQEVKARLNEDCMNGAAAGNAVLCRDGLLAVAEVANFIPYCDMIYAFASGRTILVYDRNRTAYEINTGTRPFKKIESLQILDKDQFMKKLEQRAPWAYYGKSMENRKKFIMFAQMVDEVDLRRRRMSTDYNDFT